MVAGGSAVLAAGTGTARLAAALHEKVPHQAVGGYHVMLGTPGVVLETPLLPLDFRFAITPMRDGIRLAGTYEFGGAARPPIKAKIADMLRHIPSVLPGIDTAAASTWRGFRSYLPDALPVISASRRVNGLYYMFGFSSSGMINGAAAGQAIARMGSVANSSVARPDGCEAGRTGPCQTSRGGISRARSCCGPSVGIAATG